ncbi:KAP family NTPase [Sansalvadorimonas sp. 2012CJ34-2]|uniref:KAP family NTPase n=1 Tax=Parendozoicomonas callyspongiae TaxID=2942213 RepID=A0ABT0PLI5_9GAMM|nr:P-loop NTPase fold protein [Sansalvadorimonas sp. 2012CJ34-2]MCL6272255.1 KAP family NTPase [Sansalvadorimonas sp. 2012CJ34-2]
MTSTNYSSDTPVSSKENDRFSRWSFSERVAQVIAKRTDPSCITVGLYGAWGDGKTSVLNFIETSLEDNEDVICINFNPWRFTSEENLLSGFFHSIADALDAKLIKTEDKLKDIIKKSASGFAAAAGAKGVGDSIASFISGPDLEELRTRIEHELEEAKKRILIFIDDIDRLEKEEIHAIFKLVKLTADFKYTSYILAFDKDVVSDSLQERYSSSNKHAGEAFLEKIIQVPLHLPAVEKKALREFCYAGINEALSLAEISLTSRQVQEFMRDFTYAFDQSLSTPRKAKLYGNTLLFALPILKGEVNPADLMIIEGFRVFTPNLYENIRTNKDYFTGVFRESRHGSNDALKEKIKNIINKSLDEDKIEEKEGYIQVLQNLFPKLNSVYGNMTYGSDWYEQWNNEQRACTESYFSRYFSYSIPHDDIADQAILDMIKEITSIEDTLDKEKNPFPKIITSSNSETLIRKLRNKVSHLEQGEVRPLALTISAYSSLYPNPETLYNFTVPFTQAAMLISDLVQRLDKDERISLAKDCIQCSDGIDFRTEIFRWLKREDENKPEREGFNQDEQNEIGSVLGNSISEYLTDDLDITISNPNNATTILYSAKEYINKEFSENYLVQQILKDPYFIYRLLYVYTPTAWGMESGVSHKSDFERSQYDNLISVICPEIVKSAVKDLYTDEVSQDESYPHNYDHEDESILLKQFLWIHNYATKESIEGSESEA